jgi:hypothetical protein
LWLRALGIFDVERDGGFIASPTVDSTFVKFANIDGVNPGELAICPYRYFRHI